MRECCEGDELLSLLQQMRERAPREFLIGIQKARPPEYFGGNTMVDDRGRPRINATLFEHALYVTSCNELNAIKQT